MSTHVHSFREITDYLDLNISVLKDDILHVFKCPCGVIIIKKKRNVKSGSRQKKMTIYTVVRK